MIREVQNPQRRSELVLKAWRTVGGSRPGFRVGLRVGFRLAGMVWVKVWGRHYAYEGPHTNSRRMHVCVP